MMQYQYLAVIFVIIMLPITLVFSAYIDAQLDTMDLQISYDTKLDNATYDAIKAFQINTASSYTSDIADSKILDIEAAANSFYTSIATNFNMAGYNSDVLQNYVPALVFTLYDGFYIYSTFENTLDVNLDSSATYKDGDTITGLKPYIYYSCRYTGTGQLDVVITYSLDSYITVQGTASDGTPINDAGYLLTKGSYNETTKTATYRGVTITEEDALTEYMGTTEYTYIKLNGVKYYYNGSEDSWFSLLERTITSQPALKEYYATKNDLAYLYYKESYEFMNRLEIYGITSLTSANAVDADGNPLTDPITDENGNTVYSFTDSSTERIFDFDGIEEPDSAFNNHRRAVIRYVIESNLSTALANYTIENSTYEFKMPKLSEEDWDKIMSNVTLISFLQGLSIGGKIYNGYSVINNNENYEVVTENSIYIVEDKSDSNSTYHRITDLNFQTASGTSSILTNNAIGIFNMDVERRTVPSSTSETTLYYYPHYYLGCYTCYVAQTNTASYTNIYEYIDDCSDTVKKLYYTALGRERYSMYRIFRNDDTHLSEFRATE